jgi:hypothetical protein
VLSCGLFGLSGVAVDILWDLCVVTAILGYILYFYEEWNI